MRVRATYSVSAAYEGPDAEGFAKWIGGFAENAILEAVEFAVSESWGLNEFAGSDECADSAEIDHKITIAVTVLTP